MVRFTFIETNLSAALHITVEQPFDDEQRPLDTSDFAKGDGQIMLSWPCRQLLQKLTGLHPARKHRCYAAQHIRPVGDDGIFPDFVAHQALQFSRYTAAIKDMQPFGRQVPDARDEQITKQRRGGEHKICHCTLFNQILRIQRILGRFLYP